MNPLDLIHESWRPVMGLLNQEPLSLLNTEILPNCAYHPRKEDIFRVFRMPLQNIKVVILGQDPYVKPGQANGLAFAVHSEIPIPPSLKIIAEELTKEGYIKAHNGHPDIGYWKTLEHWEAQGVFLLNTALTVESGRPGSHLRYWETFIQRVVNYIAWEHPCIWLLWGRQAQALSAYMPRKSMFEVKNYSRETIEDIPGSYEYNYILRAAHPAAEAHNPNGAGYYGCDHFYFVNKILPRIRQKTINW